MDPDACLHNIVKLIRKSHDTPQTEEDLEVLWSELSEHFDNLGQWLRQGGFPPSASGAIFGTGPVAVGYPGMTLQSMPRFEQRPICHVKSSRSNWRYAIMVKTANREDLSAWCMDEYDSRGALVNHWEFEPRFCCPSCDSKGFDISVNSPLRCSFCDNTACE